MNDQEWNDRLNHKARGNRNTENRVIKEMESDRG